HQHRSGGSQAADFAFANPAPAAGPYVVASTPAGYALAPQSSVRVQFDRPIIARTFTTDDIVSFTRTVGSTVTDLRGAITGVTPVAGAANQVDITFQRQTALGIYSLTSGPDILDRSHNPMDQNHNLIAGEGADTDERGREQDESKRHPDTGGADAYTATFVIQGLRVNASALDSNVPGLA